MKKIWKEEFLASISYEDLTGSVNDAITFLVEVAEPYKLKGFKDFQLGTNSWRYHDGLELTGKRIETEAEATRRERRLISHQKSTQTKKDKKEIQEKKLLMRLQKKYGVDSSIIE